MVKIKEDEHLLADGSIDLNSWLRHLDDKHHYSDVSLIRNACLLSQLAGQDRRTATGESCLQQGLAMAEILVDLEVDQETIAAAIVYDSVQYSDLSVEDINEQLGERVGKLVACAQRMDAIKILRNLNDYNVSRDQLDNVRKMLLSMVDDVRGVLIKLAERLRVLRTAINLSDNARQSIAKEAMDIYAPLANRLGIGSIKWEMEDLAFRHLETEKYKEIAKGLKARRVDRDLYVKKIVNILNEAISRAGITDFKVYGRSKHIHSIFRKMQRKNVSLSEIYDATALRVLVKNEHDCYAVLGLVHHLWQQIPIEFDDYIANPKPNGYRSLHTAVNDEEGRNFEVQIRTYEMHDKAELGVAAHWKYKEGAGPQKESHERKIEWLREVLSWHQEVAKSEGLSEQFNAEFIEDRVYIFTPKGDIIDLPQGSTPLDFAYHIHSEVGNRCRGAKINGKIVNLTHILKTGEQVEILTGKLPKPSRDWINPHLGYLKSSRAKAKIHHFFKQQDYDKNRNDGAEILDRELRKLNLKMISIDQLAQLFNLKQGSDLLAAIGAGDIRVTQIIAKLTPTEVEPPKISPPTARALAAKAHTCDIFIEGVGNLLSHMARCCKPIPGDEIIGYITIGKGVAIHRKDCSNILHAGARQQQRLISVSWGEKFSDNYAVDIEIQAYERQGLLRDITNVLTNEKANVLALNTNLDKNEHKAIIHVTVEIDGMLSLSRILDKIRQLPNITETKRIG